MKKLIILALLSIIVGCSALEKVGDYVNENELFTSIAVRQVVSRYIASGETLEEEKKRAEKVQSRLIKIKDYVSGNPIATISGLLEVAENSINWGELETSDRILVQDIISLLKSELTNQSETNELSDSSKIAIKGMFDTAISAAKVYLLR